jgi:hypothetical protein
MSPRYKSFGKMSSSIIGWFGILVFEIIRQAKKVDLWKLNLMPYLGSTCAEGGLEDVGFTDVSHVPTSHLDNSCPAGDNTKWTNVHFGIYYLEEKGERYTLSINFI